ncbi:MAG: hypothetical protein U9Q84_00575 [Thermodesulfobacteriota bacterium]|nr:hypothetical protein [Thermodesulfobacteriota bacterium]
MNRLFPIIATLAMLFAYTTGAIASEKVVEVEGSSFVSKEDAIRQAQRSAVELAVGVFIHSRPRWKILQSRKTGLCPEHRDISPVSQSLGEKRLKAFTLSG